MADLNKPIVNGMVFDGWCHFCAMRYLAERAGLPSSQMDFPLCLNGDCPHHKLPVGKHGEPRFAPLSATAIKQVMQDLADLMTSLNSGIRFDLELHGDHVRYRVYDVPRTLLGYPVEYVDTGIKQPDTIDVEGRTVTEWKVDVGDWLPAGFFDAQAGDSDLWAIDARPEGDFHSDPVRIIFHKQPDGSWLRTS